MAEGIIGQSIKHKAQSQKHKRLRSKKNAEVSPLFPLKGSSPDIFTVSSVNSVPFIREQGGSLCSFYESAPLISFAGLLPLLLPHACSTNALDEFALSLDNPRSKINPTATPSCPGGCPGAV